MLTWLFCDRVVVKRFLLDCGSVLESDRFSGVMSGCWLIAGGSSVGGRAVS